MHGNITPPVDICSYEIRHNIYFNIYGKTVQEKKSFCDIEIQKLDYYLLLIHRYLSHSEGF